MVSEGILAMASFLEISVTALIVLILIGIWDGVWKIIALWKSARNNKLAWFIILAIINSAGILPILYIFVFSKMGKKQVQAAPIAKKKRR